MNFIIKLLLNAIAVVITAYILPGVHLESFGYALLVAAVLSLLNVSVKPILVVLTIPATVFTLGLFLLVINALMVELTAWFLQPNFSVATFWQALFFSILLSIINSLFDRLTYKSKTSKSTEGEMQIFDKDGNRIS